MSPELVQDSLVGTLDVLLEQKSSFDYILVEVLADEANMGETCTAPFVAQATGVADPESICEAPSRSCHWPSFVFENRASL